MIKSKKTKYLSASKIKTFENCSWLYWCKYHLGLPEKTNEGALKGSVSHLILELLLKKKHKKHFNSITKLLDVDASEPIKRLIIKHLKIYNINRPEIYTEVCNFILVALQYDFFGKGGVNEDPEFKFEFNNEEPKYNLLGFIDKATIYKKDKKILITDYKTSKQKFVGEELNSNLQAMIYSLVAKKLWPKLKPAVRFLFLKFGKKPAQELEFSEDALKGLEYYLEKLNIQINNFDASNSESNFAANKPRPKQGFGGSLLCGFAKQPGQLKKDGTPMWHCAFKFPFDYYALLGKDGEMIKSYTEKKECPKPKKGEKIEKRHYEGCPAHCQKNEDNDFDF